MSDIESDQRPPAKLSHPGRSLKVVAVLIGLFSVAGLAVQFSIPDRKISDVLFFLGTAVISGVLYYLGERRQKKLKNAKTIQQLTVDDFPGVDPEKFDAWQDSIRAHRQSFKRGQWVIWIGIALELIFQNSIAAMLFVTAFIGWLVYSFTHVLGMKRKADEARDEASISRENLRAVLRGDSAEA